MTLKQLRQGKGLTVARAAAELGLSERHLYRLESGHSPLGRTVAVAMSAVYGVPVADVERAGRENPDGRY